ncbi:MAG: cupin domain-containing protein [Actinoallomurus sp.]
MAIDEPFVINLADAPAIGAPRGATFIRLEPDGVTWPDTGVNVQVMQPGEPNGRYHSEPVQEDFLVLYGECIAIVEDEERALRQWDFLHCPAGSEHIFVGAGDGPCAVLMIGSRREDACHYTVNDTAAKYGASVAKDTGDPAEAYADWRAEGPGRPSPEPVAGLGNPSDLVAHVNAIKKSVVRRGPSENDSRRASGLHPDVVAARPHLADPRRHRMAVATTPDAVRRPWI